MKKKTYLCSREIGVIKCAANKNTIIDELKSWILDESH